MTSEIEAREMKQLRDMKKTIEEIDRLACELGNIGKGLPVIEKNVIGIQSITHALKFGISDIADLV